jgi:hypothetical protein
MTFAYLELNEYWAQQSDSSATQEAETGRITVPGQPGQKVSETPSQPIKRLSGAHLSSHLYKKLYNRRIAVQASPGITI